MDTAYLSKDSGSTWSVVLGIPDGNSATASADGSKLIVAAGDGLHTTASITAAKETLKPEAAESKGKVSVKKVSTSKYTLTVASKLPGVAYEITATKKGKTTYLYNGTTDSKGIAILTVKANLAGYAVAIKFK